MPIRILRRDALQRKVRFGENRGTTMPSVIMLSSPKGGVGKSSISRNLLVSAAQAGRSVVGLDLDAQKTLTTWAERRERVRIALPGLPVIPVVAATLDEWRAGLKQARATGGLLVTSKPPATGADIMVVDTPPSIELNVAAIAALSAAADLTLVPSLPTQDDVDSTAPWMARLRGGNAKAAFVLNRANARTKSYTAMRAKLLGFGPLCPMEIPPLEEIHTAAGKGLGVLDLTKATSTDTFQGLWNYVCLEVGL
jgi:chromosome partitioning protein